MLFRFVGHGINIGTNEKLFYSSSSSFLSIMKAPNYVLIVANMMDKFQTCLMSLTVDFLHNNLEVFLKTGHLSEEQEERLYQDIK